MQGAMAFQKGLGCVHSLSHSLGGVNPRLHHGTLNALFLPSVIRFNALAESVRRENRMQRMAHAMGLGDISDGERAAESIAKEIVAMNGRLGLPSGLKALGVTPDMFDLVIQGAIADHCHKLNPRLATAEDYRHLLVSSL